MPAHLWEALEQMSSEMGVETNGLVAQAVFTLARLNGYVVPGKPSAAGAAAPASRPAVQSAPKPAARAPTAGAQRRAPEPEPQAEEPEPQAEANEEGNPFDHQPSDDYAPNEGSNDEYPPEPEPEPAPAPAPVARPGSRAALTLIVAGRDPFKMVTDAFTIGRGKTCDFVIESNRVSREHCRILREGGDFTLEDLNSSNGTFFQPSGDKLGPGRKVKLKDGDEFKLGTEKIKFQIRK
jgi:hypothetical protein